MLEITNLSVEYDRRGQKVPAVENLSLTIEPGETVGLVGESGSGKSTVALAILRLIRPSEGRITQGRIRFNGQDLLLLPDKEMRQIRGRRIAMIFQDPFTALNPVMTVRDQMREGIPDEKDEAAAMIAALEHVQLDPVRTLAAYPHQLSGGQRQRVLIAGALLGRPELLLADEPTTALDVIVQKEILDLLFSLQRELKLGVLFISHNLGLVGRYTQRIAVMQAGRLVETGASQTLFTAPQHPYTQALLASARSLAG